MPIYELKDDHIEPLSKTTFRKQGLKERQDLQRLLQEQIQVVDPDVMVLAEEFGRWDDSKRRIDLLALDRNASLVVIELKRTEDGGHMELQALRYAAMVARMTFEQAVEAHASWLAAGKKDMDAEKAILDFLGWDEPDEESFGQDVRIVLVSGDFSKEVTTSVLWLNERGLDVRCVRMQPYENDGRVLVDVQQVIPLPEAGEYLIQVREKQRKKRNDRESARDFTHFDVTVGGVTQERLAKRRAVQLIVKELCSRGVTPDEISQVIPSKGSRLWRSQQGELGASEFAERMEEKAQAEGATWDPRRWFCDEGDLIHSVGKTWALTNQWGGKTREAIRGLLESWSNFGIEVRESEG